MSDVPVVWLNQDAPSRDQAARSLAEWARARGVVLSVPSPRRPPIVPDAAVAEAAEKELARALSADDDDTASRAIGRAEALLRDHPELPAAPFLRAEVSRAWSRLRLRQGDEAGAAAAWQDAEALDGGRVAGIGEKSVAAPAKVPLTIRGAEDVTVDGHASTGGSSSGSAPIPVLPGEHAIVAKRDGAMVYAAWIAVRGPLELTLPVRDDACSLPAFAGVKRDGARVLAPGVTCPTWLAAEPSAQGVLIARCERDVCDSPNEWRGAPRDVFALPPPDRSRSPLPGWATWTVLGISAATVASVVLIAAGTFESRPVETRFVVGGTKQQ